MKGIVKPIVVGPDGIFIRTDGSPSEYFRTRVKAGACGHCGAARGHLSISLCDECRVERRAR